MKDGRREGGKELGGGDMDRDREECRSLAEEVDGF